MKDYNKKFLNEIKDYDLTLDDFTDKEVEEITQMLRNEDNPYMIEDGSQWSLMAIMDRSLSIDEYLKKHNKSKNAISRDEHLDLICKYEQGKL